MSKQKNTQSILQNKKVIIACILFTILTLVVLSNENKQNQQVKENRQNQNNNLNNKIQMSENTLLSNFLSNFPSEIFWYDGTWPQEKSDIPADPQVIYGRLSNGFRYAIIPHEKTNNKVSLYLDVQVGSLMERKEQQGFAHYVEHMAFNGSKNFPAGSLIPFFQKNGMSFGGDTNAHTSLLETVYKLNLAFNDKNSIQFGLNVLRDFADGVLFEEKEVKEEMGIIIAEKKARDSEAMINRNKRQALMYPNTVFEQSLIGTEETIKSATSQNLSEFYNTWYVPERMILVAVGAVNIKELEKMISDSFSTMKKSDISKVYEDWGGIDNPLHEGLRIFPEKRVMDGVEVSIISHFPRTSRGDSKQFQQESFIAFIVDYSLQKRLQIRGQENPELWLSARSFNRSKSGLLPSIFFMSTTRQEKWQEVLTVLSKEMQRIQMFGISQEELNSAQIAYEKNLQRYKEQFASFENNKVADLFVNKLNSDEVYTSFDFDEEFLKELQEKVTLSRVNEEIKKSYNNNNISLIVGSTNPPSEEEINKVWKKSQALEITPYILETKVQFPYLDLPKKVHSKELEQLEKRKLAKVNNKEIILHSAKLKNGIEFYALPLSFSKDTVTIQLILGNGYKDFSNDKITLAQFTNAVLKNSGLGNLSLSETRQITEEIGGSASESYGLSNMGISVKGDAQSFEKLLQTVWTQYVDPNPTQNALTQVKLAYKNQEHARNNTVEGVIRTKAGKFFYGNAKRYSSLDYKDIEKISLNNIISFINEERKKGNIKILISGDFNLEESYQLVAQYFSDIKLQHIENKQVAEKLIFPTNKHEVLKMEDIVDKASLITSWFVEIDIKNRKLMAERQLATALLRDKIREEIREEMGAAYSPSIVYRTLIQENGYGLLQLTVNTDAEQLKKVYAYVQKLKPWNVDKETLNRLRAPMITAWEKNRNNDTTWQRLVQTELVYDLPFTQWDNEYKELLLNTSPEEVSRALKEMLSSPVASWAISSVVKK